MIKNTHCKNCIFSSKVTNNEFCSFDIINNIKNKKECIIKDDYWYIKNYACKFGLGKNTYESIIKSIADGDIDIKQQIILRNMIKYYLIINYNNINYPIDEFCQQLNSLEIVPKYVSVLFYKQTKEYMLNVLNTFKTVLDCKIQFKIHHFIDHLTVDEAIFSALETNTNKNNSNYLWILNIDSVQNVAKRGDIQAINYQINIEQPVCNLLKSKYSTDDLDTLFCNFENYSGLTKNINQSLSIAIKSIPNLIINYYD